MMRSSYPRDDVTVLLKDVSGAVTPLDTAERERLIQSGVHYSEMLPVEYQPTEEYLRVFDDALLRHSGILAAAIAAVSEKILKLRSESVALVSLARAGTPIGVLIKRYLRRKYGLEPAHYTISIIRGRGIDHAAMRYILDRHSARDIQFIDGWTGKGAIIGELTRALAGYPDVPLSLAVAADPARIADIAGTRDDILIASSCLNSTVSGLLSRTFLNDRYIGTDDFHGAVYYGELENHDRTMDFISAVETKLYSSDYPDLSAEPASDDAPDNAGVAEAQAIADAFGVRDINFVKPGLGETVRVLLRRVPWKILVRDFSDTDNTAHIMRLAHDKGVPVELYPLKCYRACGIIRDLSADL